MGVQSAVYLQFYIRFLLLPYPFPFFPSSPPPSCSVGTNVHTLAVRRRLLKCWHNSPRTIHSAANWAASPSCQTLQLDGFMKASCLSPRASLTPTAVRPTTNATHAAATQTTRLSPLRVCTKYRNNYTNTCTLGLIQEHTRHLTILLSNSYHIA